MLVFLGFTCVAGCNGSDANPSANGDVAGSGDASTSTDNGTPTEDVVEADASNPVPLINSLTPPCDGSTKGPSPGVTPGEDLHRVVLDNHPNAVCNDGSPAVMYIRAAASDDASGEWLFHLQGGSACRDYATCRDRWCGNAPPYHAGKMSSQWTVESMKGSGILNRREGNPLAQANLVYVYYCSSDSHRGTRSDVVYSDPENPSDQIRVHHRGNDIIVAVLDTLLAGSTVSDDGQETVPNLSEATRVLFTGTSAGSGGVAGHLDYVASRLPSANVLGVFDAGMDPAFSMLSADLQAAVGERTDWDKSRQGAAPVVDASCLAANESDPSVCLRNTYVRLNHITTPFFGRMDLADSVLVKGYLGASPGLDLPTLAGWVRETLLMFGDVMTEAEETPSRLPGIYAPACQQHVGLTSEDWYDGATVEDSSGTPMTLRAALERWLGGQDVGIIDTVPPSLSACSATNDARD